MEESTEILNELQSISPLIASLPKVNVLEVPDGYFTALEQKIVTSVLLHQDEKKEGLQVPEGYFDTLSTRILDRIKNENTNEAEEEINSLSPVLYSLKNKNVFTVPPDYFQNLSVKINSKLNKKGEGKVISIGTKKQWWKYAAAAVIAGAITITSLQIFNTNSNDNNSLTASAKMPEYIKLSFQYKTPQELNQGIASLTDDEIVDYLEKSGSIIDDELLTTGTNTDKMPAPYDYLIDENALNNYLNMIDAQGTDKNTQ